MNRISITLFVVLAASSMAHGVAPSAGKSSSEIGVTLVPSLPGLAAPKQQVSLSVPVDGVLSDVFANEGDRVEPNTILAKLDTRTLEQELRVAEAEADNDATLLRSRHTLDFAERSLKRSQEMLKTSAVSKRAFDEAQTSYEIALSNMQQVQRDARAADLRCEVIRTSIDVRNIRAPFAGHILEVLAQPGQSVKMENSVAVLANLDELRFDLHLPIAIYNKVQVGQHYQIIGYVPNATLIDARLVSIEPVLNAAVGTFRCRFEFDNRRHQYPIGFAVRLVQPAGASDWPEAETVRVAVHQ